MKGTINLSIALYPGFSDDHKLFTNAEVWDKLDLGWPAVPAAQDYVTIGDDGWSERVRDVWWDDEGGVSVDLGKFYCGADPVETVAADLKKYGWVRHSHG